MTRSCFRITTALVLVSLALPGCGPRNIRPEAKVANITGQLVVMALNIRHGCGREDPRNTTRGFFEGCNKHLDELAAAVRSADPDIVGLQEVNVGQASALAEALGMNYVFRTHNPSGYASWFGNAILAKFTILDSDAVSTGGPGDRNRSAVTAVLRVNDKPLAVVSVHAHHQQANDVAVKNLVAHAQDLGVPTLLVGDFNMEPDDGRLDLLRHMGFVDSGEAAPSERLLGTFQSPYGRRIDYVFVPNRHFEVVDAKLVPEAHHYASDHIAYVATLRVR